MLYEGREGEDDDVMVDVVKGCVDTENDGGDM
jgi:hypothetical protein